MPDSHALWNSIYKPQNGETSRISQVVVGRNDRHDNLRPRLYDQKGDAARGRQTAPIIFGDTVARWTIIASVLVWSVIMPACLGLSLHTQLPGYMIPTPMRLYIGSRLLLLHDAATDKLTLKV